MAKPILIIRIDEQVLGRENASEFQKKLSDHFKGEYYVLIVFGNHPEPVFECYNDCKGLSDIDIEKLISELNDPKTTK